MRVLAKRFFGSIKPLGMKALKIQPYIWVTAIIAVIILNAMARLV